MEILQAVFFLKTSPVKPGAVASCTEFTQHEKCTLVVRSVTVILLKVFKGNCSMVNSENFFVYSFKTFDNIFLIPQSSEISLKKSFGNWFWESFLKFLWKFIIQFFWDFFYNSFDVFFEKKIVRKYICIYLRKLFFMNFFSKSNSLENRFGSSLRNARDNSCHNFNN